MLLRNAGFVRGMEYFGGGSNCKTVGGDFNIYCSFPCSCWGKVPLDEHMFASPKHQGWAHMFVNFNLRNKTQIVHLQKLLAKQKHCQIKSIASYISQFNVTIGYNWCDIVGSIFFKVFNVDGRLPAPRLWGAKAGALSDSEAGTGTPAGPTAGWLSVFSIDAYNRSVVKNDDMLG